MAISNIFVTSYFPRKKIYIIKIIFNKIWKRFMKVMASVKRICRNCKVIKRKRVVRVICTDPRHKQRQG